MEGLPGDISASSSYPGTHASCQPLDARCRDRCGRRHAASDAIISFVSCRAALCLLPPDEGLLAEALAALSAEEAAVAAGYRFPKRRHDWLLGRLAAKRALQTAGGGDALQDLIVTSGERGRPGFSGAPALAGWDLSITHGHGRAAALVAPALVGIDLEAIRELEARGWRYFMDEREREWVAAGGAGLNGEILVWALKEAAYKALENRATQVLDLRVAAAADGRARITFGAEVLVARYWRLVAFFLAIATPAEAEPPWLAAIAPPPDPWPAD